MKKYCALLLAICLLFLLSACGNPCSVRHDYQNGVCINCGRKDAYYCETFTIGQTWVVDGLWEITITGVNTHELCNYMWDNDHQVHSGIVLTIDYTYKNIGYTGPYTDSHLGPLHMSVYQGNGDPAPTYACVHQTYPDGFPVGEKRTARSAFYLPYKADASLEIWSYSSTGVNEKAKFILDLI